MLQEILDQYYLAERAINAYQKGRQQQLGIMCGLMHRLVPEEKEVYLQLLLVTQAMQRMSFPCPHSMQTMLDMTWHGMPQKKHRTLQFAIRHLLVTFWGTFITTAVRTK